MLLEESGERKQSELADLLEVQLYALSRLLTTLGNACYVTRVREGNDKIVIVPQNTHQPIDGLHV